MKRFGNLYARCFTPEALYSAYLRAAKGKHDTRACFEFERRLGPNLQALHEELASDTYLPRPYYTFEVFEPKRRMIYAPAFRDLVVQHAIYAVIAPIFDATFIDQSFACRFGRGTHAASDYAQRALQAAPRGSFTLKLDIRRFFYRIDRVVLAVLFRRRIKDERLVQLMLAFADHGQPVGIPIGNLLSQLYALIYLNPLDHFVKRILKVRWYARYVDDFVLFGLSRAVALAAKARIESFIKGLRLEYSKWSLAPVSRGLNFVGYRIWASRRFIRRHALYNFRRAVRLKRLDSIVALISHAWLTHSRLHLLRILKARNHDLYLQLPKTHYA